MGGNDNQSSPSGMAPMQPPVQSAPIAPQPQQAPAGQPTGVNPLAMIAAIFQGASTGNFGSAASLLQGADEAKAKFAGAQAAQRAQTQSLKPLVNQFGVPEQSFAVLPLDQQLQVLGHYQKQQDFGMAQQREARQGEQFKQDFQLRKESANQRSEQFKQSQGMRQQEFKQREKAFKLQESSQALRAKGIELQNIHMINDIQDKAEKKQAQADARETLKPASAFLTGNDKLKYDSALATGDFKAARDILTPKAPKPGTPQALIAAHQAGQVDITDPKQVEDYFASNLTKGKSDPAASNFMKAYTKDPGFFGSLFGSKRELNEQGQAAIQGGQQAAPATTNAPPPASNPRATNPQTGEVVEFINGKWTPVK